MQLLKGRTTVRWYHVLGSRPAVHDPQFIARILANRFREPTGTPIEGDTAGWIGRSHPFDVDISLDQILFEPFIVLRMRLDRLRVPRPLMAAYLERDIAHYREANDVERVPVRAKQQLREQVRAELLERIDAVPKVIEAFWHVRADRVGFCSRGKLDNEMFRRLFLDTFELELGEATPLHVACAITGGAQLEELSSLEPTLFSNQAVSAAMGG